MTLLALDGVFSGPLQGASLGVESGLTVVLATPEDGGAELPPLFAGLVVPRRGRVRVAEVDPAGSPETRARLGVVLADEPSPPARTLLDVVRQALGLRKSAEDPAALLARHGLSAFASTTPAKVGPSVRRQLAWALALAVERPLGLIVYEPLALGDGASRERLCGELTARAESGVPVLVITASPRDASALGGSVVLLDRGRFVRRPGVPLATELAPGAVAAFRLRTPNARALASALVTDGAVSGIEWDDRAGSDELRVRGENADRLALAVLTHTKTVGARLTAIQPELPALEVVRAATRGLWQAAYEGAHRSATAHAIELAAAPTGQQSVSPAATPSAPPPPPASTPPSPSTASPETKANSTPPEGDPPA